MEAMEIRVRIKRLEESNRINDVLVKDHMKYLKVSYTDKLLVEQQDIIDAAVQRIHKVEQRSKDAVFEIAKIDQQQRYNNKKLIELRNYKKVQELKRLIEKRKSLQDEMKGDQNGLDEHTS